MMIAHSKNFCICQLTACNRTFYFLNEYRNGKPTTNAAEKAGRYYLTPEEALTRLEQRQAAYDEGLNKVKHLI